MTIQSTDQTGAADVIHYLIDSQAAVASATTQKQLTDDTTGDSVATDPVDLALTADEQAQVLAAADAAITAILAARTAAAQSAGSSAAATAPAPASDSSTDSAAVAGTDSTDATAPVQS